MSLLRDWMLQSVFPDLSVCCRVRVLSDNAKVTLLLQVIDSSTVITKAIIFHGSVHIPLGHSLRFFQGLIIQPLIKAVLKVVVDSHLIPGGHAVGVILDLLPGEPVRFFGQSIVQLPHFVDLCGYISGP